MKAQISIEKTAQKPTFFLAAFVIVVALIVAASLLYYNYAEKSYRVFLDEELTAIGDLKEKQISKWMEERLADVSIFYNNHIFSLLVQQYFSNPDDAETNEHLQLWLQNVRTSYAYKSVFIMDSNGVKQFSFPKLTTPISSVISGQHSEIMNTKKVSFVDFYRDDHDNQIYLAVLSPILHHQDTTRVIGVVGLQIDPREYLYPFLQRWPTSGKTSETLILRREGNEVVFLNDLKFQKDAALNLRAPMNDTKAIPAIKAALGEEGIVEALDYRGVPVIAAIRTIHGSPWFMVARMDKSEAYAPLKNRIAVLAIILFILLIGIGIGVYLLWRLQRMQFYRERYKASEKLRESEVKYKALAESLNVMTWEFDPVHDKWNYVAPQSLTILGYEPEEWKNFNWWAEHVYQDDREFAVNYCLNETKKRKDHVLEYRFTKKDGTIIWVQESVNIQLENDIPVIIRGFIMDITARKQKEEQLIIQTNALNAAANAFVITNNKGEIEWINPAFTKLTGYTLEEVTGENPRSLKSGKHDNTFYKNIWDTVLAGKIWHSEIINKRKDGSEYTEEMTITPLKDENGKIIRFIAVKQDITARKLAEEELQKSEENVRLLLDSTAEAIYGIDLEGKCTFSNKSCLRLLGYERSDQLIGMDMHNLIHHSRPNGSPLLKKGCSIYKAFQSGKGTHKDDEVFWRADGTSFPVEYWSYPIFRNGKIEGAVATFLDITERKWIEETQTFLLQCGYSESDGNFFESLARYLAKTLDMDYVCIDKLLGDLLTAQTVAVYYDGKFEDNIEYTLKGTPCGEVVEKTSCNFPHNTHQVFPNHKLIQEMLAESYIGTTLFSNTGQPIGLIALIGRKPLKNRYLAESILKLVAIRAAGEMERKFAEEEIQKLQQQIDYIYGATKTGLHIVDIDFNLYYVSSALQQIYGNYTGRKCYEYFKEFDEACEECLVRQAIETGLSVIYETTYPLENNRPVQATTIPFQDKNGKWLVAEVTVDITERKKFEEELSKAKAESERANLAKSEFLSGMSHELRTPMNSILGFAQLMNMGELKPAHKKGVDHILKSGKHLLSLINEVLELSRIEAGKISFSLEPVQLNDIISEAMDIVRPLATQHNLTFNLSDSPGNDLFAKADKQRLRQILLNLLSNAVKYNRDGGSVLVKCELDSQQAAVNNSQSAVDSRTEDRGPETEDRRPTVRISVTDTGNGIAPENIAKLFTPFERIGADKLKIEGSGIGLSVTRKLTEAMQGKIGVESEVGKGSTFWIELPQAESQLGRHKQFNSQIIPEQEKTLVNGTILYIEDNESNIQLVEQVLEAHRPGIYLVTEMYGERAVKLACDYSPDLILLDLDLPDIHGSEVLKLLQAEPKTAAIPVVVISADAMTKQIEKLMKAGAKDYLTKPLDVMEFLKVVDEYMSKTVNIK